MQFTPLETALITLVGAVFSGIFVRVRSVSKTECREHRGSCKIHQDEIAVKFAIIFRMLRALVTYSNMPEDKKVRIINDKGDD